MNTKIFKFNNSNKYYFFVFFNEIILLSEIGVLEVNKQYGSTTISHNLLYLIYLVFV